MGRLRMVKTESELNAALNGGYEAKATVRGWLLVSAEHPTLKVSRKLAPVLIAKRSK